MNTLRVQPDINEIIDFDNDVANFKFDDLKVTDVEEMISSAVVDEVVKLGSNDICCHATSSHNNVVRRQRKMEFCVIVITGLRW